jgi:signal transduction histidine kinase
MVRLADAQRRARRIAEVRAEEARGANEAKDRFLDLVSHELRGPLHSIRLWLRIASKERCNPDTVERACASIDNCVRQQDRLVADLLDAARVRAGTIAIDLRPIPLHTVVGRAVETVAPAAEAKGVVLASPQGDVELPVLADPDRLGQVLWNLLMNAVKFTDRDGRVEIVTRRRDRSVEVHVRDTGRGLSAEECARVFRPYWQRERGDGLGLGLMIAQRLVALHGGELSVSSGGPGQGADFVVSLPLADVADARVRPAG